MSRLLVTGSRDWTDDRTVERALAAVIRDVKAGKFWAYTPALTLVHGDCRGLDKMAESIWLRNGWGDVEPRPADWGGQGKRAGFIRNSEMVALGPFICLAFIKNESKGATMCVDLAKRVGIPTRVFRE